MRMMARMMRAIQSSLARWREIVRRQRASGLSLRMFCERAGVPQSSFYAWRRRVEAAPRFAEVRVMSTSGRSERSAPACVDGVSSGIELRWADGRRVVLQRGFDHQTLADLLQVLQNGAAREADA
jgi:hypothetical protein